MLRSGVIVMGVRPSVDSGSLIAAAEITVAVIEPEGNIHTGDLLQSLLGCKFLGQQGLSLAELQEGFCCIFPAFPEGKYCIRFQTTADAAGHNSRIITEGTEGCCSMLIRNDFTAASRALEAIQR